MLKVEILTRLDNFPLIIVQIRHSKRKEREKPTHVSLSLNLYLPALEKDRIEDWRWEGNGRLGDSDGMAALVRDGVYCII